MVHANFRIVKCKLRVIKSNAENCCRFMLILLKRIHFMSFYSFYFISFQTITVTCIEYIKNMVEDINTLTKHSFLSMCQANFLKTKRESLLSNEAIALGDFVENYHFIVRDKSQSYHWSKEYCTCTLYPVVVYYLDDGGNVAHKLFCFISNDNHHDTYFVCKVQSLLIDYLEMNYPHITMLSQFSDRCAGQYKNHKNFNNLCYYLDDLEWLQSGYFSQGAI